MNDIILKWGRFETSLFNSDEVIVEEIENLTWGNNEIATTVTPYTAGDNVQNVRPMARDIVITLKPKEGIGDYSPLLHKYNRLFGQSVFLIWKNRKIPSLAVHGGTDTPYPDLVTDLQIQGVVSEIDCPRFNDSVRIILNVHCADPYWTAKNYSTVTDVYDGGYATAFCNYSEVDTGFELEIANMEFTSADKYVRLDIQADPYPYELIIKPIWKGSTISAAYNYFKFTKGKVVIKSGASKATAIDATGDYTWELKRGVPVSDNEYVMENYNGIPVMPVGTGEMLLILDGFTGDADSATMTWYPKFI